MSAIPLGSNAAHSKHIRRAYNRRRDAVNVPETWLNTSGAEKTAATGTALQRSHSSCGRLETANADGQPKQTRAIEHVQQQHAHRENVAVKKAHEPYHHHHHHQKPVAVPVPTAADYVRAPEHLAAGLWRQRHEEVRSYVRDAGEHEHEPAAPAFLKTPTDRFRLNLLSPLSVSMDCLLSRRVRCFAADDQSGSTSRTSTRPGTPTSTGHSPNFDFGASLQRLKLDTLAFQPRDKAFQRLSTSPNRH